MSLAWICGKHLGVIVPDGQGCSICSPAYDTADDTGKKITKYRGTLGGANPTLFTAGTPEYAAWDAACKVGDLALVKKLEAAALAKVIV